MNLTNNKFVTSWIEEMAALTEPAEIVWIDGSEEQLEKLRAEAMSTGEIIKLNEELLPGCYLHLSDHTDVARVEDRTFICTPKEEDAGPTNNWMAPEDMYAKLNPIYKGSMRGRTMYVIPYSMGVVGSPFAKYGVELSDSIYVVISMNIMTRIGKPVLDALGNSSDFMKCLHAKADLDPENRYITHFPEDNVIMSVNSGYGGNVLLKNASHFAWHPISDARKIGSQSTCSFSALKILRAKSDILQPHSPQLAEKPTLQCLFPPMHTRKKAGKFGVSAMISHGCASDPTADYGLLTPRTASLVLPPAQA